MALQKVEEILITKIQSRAIHDLLQISFEQYPADRIYHKQIPAFRLLYYRRRKLIGHVAVEYRMVGINQTPHPILGLTDICVHPDFQNQNIATRMLEHLNKFAAKRRIDFIFLTTSNPKFYKSLGYKIVQSKGRWLAISNHRSFGVWERDLGQSLLVLKTGDQDWEDGILDFMGHIF